MSNPYEIVLIDDDLQWDELVTAAPGGTPFHASSWLQCIQEAMGEPVRRWGCLRNGRLLAGLSGLEQRRAGRRRLLTPPLAPYGGFLSVPGQASAPGRVEAETHHVLESLIQVLEQRYGTWALTHPPSLKDIRPFLWQGARAHIRYTYHLDTTDSTRLWQRLERRVRTVVRKAQAAGWTVHPSTDAERFQHQYQRLYQGRHIPPPVPVAWTASMMRRVLSTGLARGVEVRSTQGETAAMVVFVEGADTLYAWMAGADPAFQASGAVSLLYWRVLEDTPRPVFDFVGANLPSIARFKRGFGGRLVPYFATEQEGSMLWRGLGAGWKLLRRMHPST